MPENKPRECEHKVCFFDGRNDVCVNCGEKTKTISLAGNERIIASTACPHIEIAQPEKLTNGGKPHICGEIAVHSGNNDEVSICLKCKMPVDTSQPEKGWEVELRKILSDEIGYENEVYYGKPFEGVDGKLTRDDYEEDLIQPIINFISQTIEREREKLAVQISKERAGARYKLRIDNQSLPEPYETAISRIISSLLPSKPKEE